MKLKYFLTTCCSVILLNTSAIARAAVQGATPLPSETPTMAQAKPAASAQPNFEQMRQDMQLFYGRALGDNYYTLYRIIDRIARANELDNIPWRVLISPEYDLNAFATDVNLVAFYNGLLDRVHGDPDAIACVVGHEMAHHTQNHMAMGTAQREEMLAKAQAEAFEEVAAEEEDLRADLEGLGIGERVAGGAGAIVGATVGGTEGAILREGLGVVRGLFGRSKEERVREATERIETITAEKVAQLTQEWSELDHKQEFEADEMGYTYMARAGFNPQGCQTVMTVLSRLGVTESATHPAIPDRVSALEELATKYPKATLAAEGNSNLAANPTPLTYDLSGDNTSLRINSRAGSRNIDDLLPR